MASNVTSFISQLSSLSSNANRYGSLILFVLGSVGVVLNMLVFGNDHELKKNPCSRLFLASSVASSLVLLFGAPTRFFSSFGLDLTARYDVLCKCYIVTLFTSLSCSALFTSFLSVERWLNSCVNVSRRTLSTMRNVTRTILISVLLVFVCYSQIFYCYLANQKSERSGCGAIAGFCSYFNDFLHLSLFVFIPCTVMVVFGSLTLYNIKHNLRRITQAPQANLSKVERRTQKTQSTITILMFTQVFALTVCTLPSGVQKVYSTITASHPKTAERRALEAAIFQFVFLLNYVGVALPFYLYTLAGALFRKALLHRLHIIFRCGRMLPQAFHSTTQHTVTIQPIPVMPLKTFGRN